LNVSTKRLKSMDCDCLNRATQINELWLSQPSDSNQWTVTVSTERLKSMDCDCLDRATQINGLWLSQPSDSNQWTVTVGSGQISYEEQTILRKMLVDMFLRAILCKDQRTIKVLRNSMSQNMLIFTSYVSYGILNSNIDMKIEKKKWCCHGNK
jgi:hypothetical protein